eukprot:4966293-Karenia_brevis.AAC.1
MVSDQKEAKAWDDVGGSELPMERVREERRKEVQYMDGRNLWTRVPEGECGEVTGKGPHISQ